VISPESLSELEIAADYFTLSASSDSAAEKKEIAAQKQSKQLCNRESSQLRNGSAQLSRFFLI